MSDEHRVYLGMWAGITLICVASFGAGAFAMRGDWGTAFCCLLFGVGFACFGLHHNHKAAVLLGRIREVERQMER